MNKYIKARPALFFACIVFGIILLIYAFTTTLNTSGGENAAHGVDPKRAVSSGQESELSSEDQKSGNGEEELSTLFLQESEEEERGKLLTREKDDSYTASRGSAGRDTNLARAAQEGSAGSQKAGSSSGQAEDPPEIKPADPAAQRAGAATEKPAAAAKPAAAPAGPVASEKPAASSAEPVAAEKPAAVPSAPTQPVTAPATDKPAPASPAESSELDLLARLITAEAQGEPYEAQVAVGAVVMNRVKSNDWPNSIKSVIYQKIGEYYQFSPVMNGWIDKPAQPEAVEAAKAAMNGSDPTGGAQFYYDDKCTNEWILAKPVSVRIGHMIFAF